MHVTISGNTCIIRREEGDKKYHTESHFLYAVKQELNKQGYDLIKKRMWKDGHLVPDIEQYLRTRKKGAGKADIYVYDSMYDLRMCNVDFNKKGEVELAVALDVFY